MLKTSMSLTMTISLWPSSKMAPLTMSRTFCWYPLVKNSIALAYLSGVASRPSRSASSPTHSRIVRTAPHMRASRLSACSLVSSSRSRVPELGRDSPSKSITGLGDRVTVPLAPAAVLLAEVVVVVAASVVAAAVCDVDFLDFFFLGRSGISRGSRAGALMLSRRSWAPFTLWCLRFLWLDRSSPLRRPPEDELVMLAVSIFSADGIGNLPASTCLPARRTCLSSWCICIYIRYSFAFMQVREFERRRIKGNQASMCYLSIGN